MANVIAKRVTAKMDGDFVIFLIGMRINKPWKLHKWLPVFTAMPRMLRELEQRPESGFLGHIQSLSTHYRTHDRSGLTAADHEAALSFIIPCVVHNPLNLV